MDTVKFIKERNRMCESFDATCHDAENQRCPAFKINKNEILCAVCRESTMDAKDQIDIVEKWSSEHPRKTRQDVFLDQYPETLRTKNDVISICPATLYCSQRDNNGNCNNSSKGCEKCRRDFWMQEIK